MYVFIYSPALLQAHYTLSTARCVEELNGHTGYLTFAQLWKK